jgi:diguanylate cyclase (GGDEF)-like protein
MSGLTIDLNEILTYLNKSFYRYAKDWANIAIISAFTLVAVTCAFELPLLAGIFASIALVAASFSLGLILFLRHIITDVSGALFLTVISTALIHAARSIRIAMDNIILKKEAITDGLTGLYLYRYFELQLKKEFKSALYSRRDLALVIYDIDHFKKINDTYGHEFGNVILKAIAKSLRDLSRKDNIMARYGGEEFCVIIPGMKRDDAIKYAERLRNMVGTLDFKTDKGENVKVTMSAGIAMIQDVSSKDHSDFIKAADSALYRSKNEGRNRISVFYKSTSS